MKIKHGLNPIPQVKEVEAAESQEPSVSSEVQQTSDENTFEVGAGQSAGIVETNQDLPENENFRSSTNLSVRINPDIVKVRADEPLPNPNVSRPGRSREVDLGDIGPNVTVPAEDIRNEDTLAIAAAVALKAAVEEAISGRFGASSSEALIEKVEARGPILYIKTKEDFDDLRESSVNKLITIVDAVLEEKNLSEVMYEFVGGYASYDKFMADEPLPNTDDGGTFNKFMADEPLPTTDTGPDIIKVRADVPLPGTPDATDAGDFPGFPGTNGGPDIVKVRADEPLPNSDGGTFNKFMADEPLPTTDIRTPEESANAAAVALEESIAKTLEHEFGASSTAALIDSIEVVRGGLLEIHTTEDFNSLPHSTIDKLYTIVEDVLEEQQLTDVPFEFVGDQVTINKFMADEPLPNSEVDGTLNKFMADEPLPNSEDED